MSARVAISKKLVLINMVGSTATQFLNITVLFWLQRHLILEISTEEYAILPVIYAVMAFTPLATVVLTGGIGRYITEAYAKGDDAGVTRICSTMFPILLAAGFVFLSMGWLFAWNIDHILNIPPDRVRDAQLMMGLLFLTAALRLPAAPFTVGFFVRQQFILQNLISIAAVLFRISVLFILLFGVSTRVLWVVTATVAMEFMTLMVTIPISMRLVPALRLRWTSIDWGIAREITSFGGWQFFMAIGLTIRNALDPIVLNTFASAWDNACYSIAALPFHHLWQTINMVKRTVNPSLIAMHAGEEQGRIRSAFLRGNRIALWAFLLPGLPLALFAHPLIRFYIKDQLWLTPALIQINFWAFLVVVPSVVFGTIVEAIGKPRDFCLLVLGVNLFNLVLTLVLVGWFGYGVLGSCVATAVSAAIGYPLLVWPLSRSTLSITTGEWFGDVLWPGVLPALCAAPIYLGAGHILGTETIPALVGALALGCAAYVTCLYTFAARSQDRADLHRLLPWNRK